MSCFLFRNSCLFVLWSLSARFGHIKRTKYVEVISVYQGISLRLQTDERGPEYKGRASNQPEACFLSSLAPSHSRPCFSLFGRTLGYTEDSSLAQAQD